MTTIDTTAAPSCVQVAGLPGVYRVRNTTGNEAIIQRGRNGWDVMYGFEPGWTVSRHSTVLPRRLDLSEAARAAVELLDHKEG